jgi:hypothetical protein
MLSVSYATAAVAMIGAAVFLIVRLRPFVTTTAMLLGSLLLIYGPTCLTYTLSSGETAFLVQRALRSIGSANPLFPLIKSKVADFDAIVIAMNFSVALMYAGVIAGIVLVDRMFPQRIANMQSTVRNWRKDALHDDLCDHRFLLVAILAILAFMASQSIAENHMGTIIKFFSIADDASNSARNTFRLHFGGSPNYVYRTMLSGVAPMFVVWGLLAGISKRSWLLLLATTLLFVVTMIGKIEMLSKAPPAFFVIQLMLAGLLVFTNRISWRVAIAAGCAIAFVLSVVTRLIMVFPQGTETLKVVYYRVFEVDNQSLFEYFATFPLIHPFMWGANLRPIAMLMGLPYMPAFSIVAYTWYGNYDTTNPSLFIADAWADFSYVGVIGFSVAAGAVCRAIDMIFLTRGKSVIAIAVLAATFLGIVTLLTTALNIAFFSGGLLLAPILAAIIMAASRYSARRLNYVNR